MSKKKVAILTIPLFPYLQAGREKPQIPKRIRPEDSLKSKEMVREIRKSEIARFNIAGKPWSLVSVLSSYSPDIHIMLIETSDRRYISGPEQIPTGEGEVLVKLWAAILELISKRKSIASIHAGYNWSPRAWGKEEERTGFQSLPTKWHPHLWGWPALDKKTSFVRKIDAAAIEPEERRLLGDNKYAKPFSKLIKKRMEETFSRDSLFCRFFPRGKWQIDGRGIYTGFPKSITKILRTQDFFGEVLKPLAAMLEKIMRELTETFTRIKCRDIDRILAKKVRKSKRDLEILRSAPVMRKEKEIRRIFKSRGYPMEFLDSVFDPISNRCKEEGNPADWWRKGFAYALIFSGPAKGNRGQLRIMPGVFVGAGGIVEGDGYIIKRPEDRKFSAREILDKSKDLRNLAEALKNRWF
jgi:hypothetical protein